MKWPWQKVDEAVRGVVAGHVGELRKDVEGLRVRIAEVETDPSLDHLPKVVEAVRGNLDHAIERLGTLAEQVMAGELSTAELRVALEGLTASVERQNFAIAEGIERTDRAERRVGATIARARKELEERGYRDAGLEAEGRNLELVDGAGGKDPGLRPVSEEVGNTNGETSSVEGVSVDEMRRARGF